MGFKNLFLIFLSFLILIAFAFDECSATRIMRDNEKTCRTNMELIFSAMLPAVNETSETMTVDKLYKQGYLSYTVECALKGSYSILPAPKTGEGELKNRIKCSVHGSLAKLEYSYNDYVNSGKKFREGPVTKDSSVYILLMFLITLFLFLLNVFYTLMIRRSLEKDSLLPGKTGSIRMPHIISISAALAAFEIYYNYRFYQYLPEFKTPGRFSYFHLEPFALTVVVPFFLGLALKKALHFHSGIDLDKSGILNKLLPVSFIVFLTISLTLAANSSLLGMIDGRDLNASIFFMIYSLVPVLLAILFNITYSEFIAFVLTTYVLSHFMGFPGL